MDAIRAIARAHFEAGTTEAQQAGRNFFDSMDRDKSGTVDYKEFETFMVDHGHSYYVGKDMFKKLDQDHTRNLDIWEVMTLYYIIKSGRPFCTYCDVFITGVYYSCVQCFEKSENPYTLCFDCYGKFKNTNLSYHQGCYYPPRLLDNYAMLEAHRISTLRKRASSPAQTGRLMSNAVVRPSASISYGQTNSHPRPSIAGIGSQKIQRGQALSLRPASNLNDTTLSRYDFSGYNQTNGTGSPMSSPIPRGQTSTATMMPFASYSCGRTPNYSQSSMGMVPMAWVPVAMTMPLSNGSGSQTNIQSQQDSSVTKAYKVLERALGIGATAATLAGCTIM